MNKTLVAVLGSCKSWVCSREHLKYKSKFQPHFPKESTYLKPMTFLEWGGRQGTRREFLGGNEGPTEEGKGHCHPYSELHIHKVAQGRCFNYLCFTVEEALRGEANYLRSPRW